MADDLRIKPLDVYRRPGEPEPELRAPETLEEWRDAWAKEYERSQMEHKKWELVLEEEKAHWRRYKTTFVLVGIGQMVALVLFLALR
jgi:hypothetical protein